MIVVIDWLKANADQVAAAVLLLVLALLAAIPTTDAKGLPP